MRPQSTFGCGFRSLCIASGMFADALIDDFFQFMRKKTMFVVHSMRGSCNSNLKIKADRMDSVVMPCVDSLAVRYVKVDSALKIHLGENEKKNISKSFFFMYLWFCDSRYVFYRVDIFTIHRLYDSNREFRSLIGYSIYRQRSRL